MSYESILKELKEKKYKPYYWLEGEEDFYIDQLAGYLEDQVLTPTEKEFNLTVFYGKDADWVALVNACRRYPMFAEKQVVMLKEAQTMKDLEKLEPYFEKPLSSTLLVVTHKWGKLDGRKRIAKLIKERGGLLTTKKYPDNQLPGWVAKYAADQGFLISEKAIILLVDHIGNELTRLANEIDKLLLNIKGKTKIDEQDVETYVGISKEYNVFELQKALGKKDLGKSMRILYYFQANPKAAPVEKILPVLYNFFNKVYLLLHSRTRNEKELAEEIGVELFFIRDYTVAARNFGLAGTEKALLLLHEYNLKNIGIDDDTGPAGLMKELVFKMLQS